jgi:hypothetical protein
LAREALVWARAWPGLTGLDATPAPPGPPERRPVDGGFARRQADEAAQRIGRFNLPIPLGPPHDTTLYLAVGTITLGDWPDSPTRRATRREAAVAWAQEQLELVFHEVSGPRPAEARALLPALQVERLDAPAEQLDLEALAEQLVRISPTVGALPPDAVVAEISRAAARTSRSKRRRARASAACVARRTLTATVPEHAKSSASHTSPKPPSPRSVRSL